MRIVDIREKERWLEARIHELGLTQDDFIRARNNGSRRTPEKRALLRRIEEEARRRGRPLPFPSNC
jgi:hypothetical protein